ncbi:MAG: class I SAM-dependent methyltransferase [Pseudomonadota bacterium]|jgi:SAM-dependent methyltransferase
MTAIDSAAAAASGMSLLGTPHCPLTALRAAELLLEAVAPNPGEMLLDLATGLGHCAGLASRRGAIATGIDSSERCLDQARRNYPDALFYPGVPESLVFAGGFFAACVQHAGPGVPSPATLAEVHRVLMPGGRYAALCLGSARVPDQCANDAGDRQTEAGEEPGAALRQTWRAAGFTRIRTAQVAIDGQAAVAGGQLVAPRPLVGPGLPLSQAGRPPALWTAVLIAASKPD